MDDHDALGKLAYHDIIVTAENTPDYLRLAMMAEDSSALRPPPDSETYVVATSLRFCSNRYGKIVGAWLTVHNVIQDSQSIS